MITARDISRMIDDEAFALVRYPESPYAELILQRDDRLHTDDQFKTDGFYIAPFDRHKHPVVVLPFDRTHSMKFPVDELEDSFRPANLTESGGTTRAEHTARIAQALEIIRKGSLQKVVLAARKEYTGQWDPIATFIHLSKTFPQSMVFYVRHPQAVSMLGATPELLFGYDGQLGLIYSLAGTKFDRRPWTDKEKEEQKFVTDFIIKKLLGWQLVLSQEGPYTHRQGHLEHLRTDIRFIINQHEKDLPRLLKYLSPTPAVAGLPRDEAIKVIQELEDFDRKYYTGFLGWKGAEEGKFYVNLRSLEILPGKIRLFAGGGITADSHPESEWEEVNQKFKILGNHLAR